MSAENELKDLKKFMRTQLEVLLEPFPDVKKDVLADYDLRDAIEALCVVFATMYGQYAHYQNLVMVQKEFDENGPDHQWGQGTAVFEMAQEINEMNGLLESADTTIRELLKVNASQAKGDGIPEDTPTFIKQWIHDTVQGREPRPSTAPEADTGS